MFGLYYPLYRRFVDLCNKLWGRLNEFSPVTHVKPLTTKLTIRSANCLHYMLHFLYNTSNTRSQGSRMMPIHKPSNASSFTQQMVSSFGTSKDNDPRPFHLGRDLLFPLHHCRKRICSRSCHCGSTLHIFHGAVCSIKYNQEWNTTDRKPSRQTLLYFLVCEWNSSPRHSFVVLVEGGLVSVTGHKHNF